MELCTWAQCCIWVTGGSRLAEVLNAGGDPHTNVAASLAGISLDEALAIMRGERGDQALEDFKDKFRQTGKIFNFGFPGGMGAKTLRKQARAEYKVHLSLEQCIQGRQVWRKTWPENFPYFKWINGLVGNSTATVTHFLSGRVRGNIPYTVTCNTFFQGLAADAAKHVGFLISQECYTVRESPLYGSRVVLFAHDEFGLEVPDHPEKAHLAAQRVSHLMETRGRDYVPDVRLRAEPVLSLRWSKRAKPKYHNGLLVPYDREVA
jgi:hypothetical protein